MHNSTTIWIVIIGLAVFTFLIRFSFLGIIGSRKLPQWFIQHLNYIGVAVMPGLIAPLLIWPEATNGILDMPRLLAAIIAFTIGIWKKSALWAVITGFTSLYIMLYFL